MTVRIWGMTRVKQSSDSDQVTISGEMTVLEGHRNWVTGVSWSPVKLANGHELVATCVFLEITPPLTADYIQRII
jgi:F0F1-type ATP synthase epsilon subunit